MINPARAGTLTLICARSSKFSGSVKGGYSVSITGENLLQGATVSFGEVSGTGTTLGTGYVDMLEFKVPAPLEGQKRALGSVNVVVTTLYGPPAKFKEAFKFTE